MNPFAAPLDRRRHYTIAPRTWVPGELVTAGMMNSIRDNLLEVGTGGVAIPGQIAKDFIYAASSTQFARLAAQMGKYPRMNFNGTAWEFGLPCVGEHDIFIPAAGMKPHATAPCGYHEAYETVYGSFTTLPFHPNPTGRAAFTIQMPRSWNLGGINARIAYINKNGAGGNIYWTMYCGSIQNWTAVTWGAANGVGWIVAAPQAVHYLHITPVGLMGLSGPAYTDGVLNFLVQRPGGDPSDTHTDYAHLIGVFLSPVTTKDVDN